MRVRVLRHNLFAVKYNTNWNRNISPGPDTKEPIPNPKPDLESKSYCNPIQ